MSNISFLHLKKMGLRAPREKMRASPIIIRMVGLGYVISTQGRPFVDVVHPEMYHQLNETALMVWFPSLAGEGTAVDFDMLDSTLEQLLAGSDSIESCEADRTQAE